MAECVDFSGNICYSRIMSPEWTLGKRLQNLRLAQNLSQRDLAKQAKMNFTYLSKIEADKMIPRKELIINLAGILGADANELINLAGEIHPALLAKIAKSDAARQFICRHAENLSDSVWEKLLSDSVREKLLKDVEKKDK